MHVFCLTCYIQGFQLKMFLPCARPCWISTSEVSVNSAMFHTHEPDAGITYFICKVDFPNNLVVFSATGSNTSLIMHVNVCLVVCLFFVCLFVFSDTDLSLPPPGKSVTTQKVSGLNYIFKKRMAANVISEPWLEFSKLLKSRFWLKPPIWAMCLVKNLI